jgi:hypothetical protein
MLPIIIKKAKIKNLIGIIDNPTYEDLLFEIAQFLTQENRLDGEFKTREVSLKTRKFFTQNEFNNYLLFIMSYLEDKDNSEKTNNFNCKF